MKEYWQSQSNNVLKKIEDNDELKSIEVDVVTNFIKDKVESCSNDVDGDSDDNIDDDEENMVIGFRCIYLWLSREHY